MKPPYFIPIKSNGSVIKYCNSYKLRQASQSLRRILCYQFLILIAFRLLQVWVIKITSNKHHGTHIFYNY